MINGKLSFYKNFLRRSLFLIHERGNRRFCEALKETGRWHIRTGPGHDSNLFNVTTQRIHYTVMERKKKRKKILAFQITKERICVRIGKDGQRTKTTQYVQATEEKIKQSYEVTNETIGKS